MANEPLRLLGLWPPALLPSTSPRTMLLLPKGARCPEPVLTTPAGPAVVAVMPPAWLEALLRPMRADRRWKIEVRPAPWSKHSPVDTRRQEAQGSGAGHRRARGVHEPS